MGVVGRVPAEVQVRGDALAQFGQEEVDGEPQKALDILHELELPAERLEQGILCGLGVLGFEPASPPALIDLFVAADHAAAAENEAERPRDGSANLAAGAGVGVAGTLMLAGGLMSGVTMGLPVVVTVEGFGFASGAWASCP